MSLPSRPDRSMRATIGLGLSISSSAWKAIASSSCSGSSDAARRLTRNSDTALLALPPLGVLRVPLAFGGVFETVISPARGDAQRLGARLDKQAEAHRRRQKPGARRAARRRVAVIGAAFLGRILLLLWVGSLLALPRAERHYEPGQVPALPPAGRTH